MSGGNTAFTFIPQYAQAYSSKVTVTDNRGYTAAKTSPSLTVYDYNNPTLSGISFPRTADKTGVIPKFTLTTSTINGISPTTVVSMTCNGITNVITNGSSDVVTPWNLSPFKSYTATINVQDNVVTGGSTSSSVVTKNTYTMSISTDYIKPTLSKVGSDFCSYYDGSNDTPQVTYLPSDSRYHKDLIFNFALNGTVTNNLTRVDLVIDLITYPNILGGSGANPTGNYTFITNVLNSGAGLTLDSQISHSGSLLLYDSANGLSSTSPSISVLNFSTLADGILLDIDGDINDGGGIGIGGYHTHSDSVLDVQGTMYLASGKDTSGNFVMKNLYDALYPIGTVYTTTDSGFNPESSWVGTWEVLTQGYLKPVSLTESSMVTGGANSVTLSVANLPAHNHTFSGNSVTTSSDSHNHTISLNDNIRNTSVEASGYGLTSTIDFSNRVMITNSGTAYTRTGTTSSDTHTHTVTATGSISNTGSGTAISVENAYYTVYMWHRIA